MNHLKTSLATLCLALVTTACGATSQSATPSRSPSPLPSATVTASASPEGLAPTELPFASSGAETPPAPPPSVAGLPPTDDPDATPPPLPEVHAEPALDAMIGIEVGGVLLSTASLTGEDAAAGGGYLPSLVSALGRETDDLATAFAEDPQHELALVIFAALVRGVEQDELLRAFNAVTNYPEATDVVIAGKMVRQIPADWTGYVYAAGDVLLIVQTPDPALAAEALNKLP